MKRIRFATFTWLILLPIFAVIKLVWELYTPNAEGLIIKPTPISWLDNEFPANVYIGIIFILTATYFSFAFINAYIKVQTTYAIALFFGILSLLAYTPELTSSLFALLLFMNGILRLLTSEENKKGIFLVFNTGFFIGLALIIEPYLIVLAIVLSLSLFLFRFSLREFLQYWAGVFIPILFVFPLLYFLDLLPNWERYFIEIPQHCTQIPVLTLADYLLIGLLFALIVLQAIRLYSSLQKPVEHILIFFLVIYFILSLLLGLTLYPITGGYIIFIVPPLTILYSLSKHENHLFPSIIVFLVIGYLLFDLAKTYPSFF
ncbi:DUF6427 family protein [Balneicella halophila]|uniref:DUF6427 family protein n=1 Tax=Balneicella halophila TaxID=1537566 RepID=UPI00105798E1|nr:DUF6427 family protein [Balneicella halophila]